MTAIAAGYYQHHLSFLSVSCWVPRTVFVIKTDLYTALTCLPFITQWMLSV